MLMVDGEELKRLRALERVVLNQLGTTDPRVAAYMIRDLQAIAAGKGVKLRGGPTDGEWYVPFAPDTRAWVPAPGGAYVPSDVLGEWVWVDGWTHDTPPHVARCAPQADGDEQDVIGLLRAYDASVDGC